MSHLGKRLSALIDGELNHTQRERVLTHLARCDSCRQEAVAMRMLKRRMHALGEATAAAALTDRLLALAALTGAGTRGGWASAGRGYLASSARPLRSVRWLAGAAIVLLGLAIPAAAFLVGGSQHQPGPSVTPPVHLFMVEHAIITGEVPAQDPSTQDLATHDLGTQDLSGQDASGQQPSAVARATVSPATAPGPANAARTRAPGFAGVARAAARHPNARAWRAWHALSGTAYLPASASRMGLATR